LKGNKPPKFEILDQITYVFETSIKKYLKRIKHSKSLYSTFSSDDSYSDTTDNDSDNGGVGSNSSDDGEFVKSLERDTQKETEMFNRPPTPPPPPPPGGNRKRANDVAAAAPISLLDRNESKDRAPRLELLIKVHQRLLLYPTLMTQLYFHHYLKILTTQYHLQRRLLQTLYLNQIGCIRH